MFCDTSRGPVRTEVQSYDVSYHHSRTPVAYAAMIGVPVCMMMIIKDMTSTTVVVDKNKNDKIN